MAVNKKSGLKWKRIFLVIVILGAGLGYYGWYKFFREEPQEAWMPATPEM